MRNIAEFQIIGHVGKIEQHDKVTHLQIAANYRRKDKESGEWQDEPYWNRVTIFNEHDRKYIAENLSQGDLVRVKGKMRDTSFDRNGETVWSTDRIVDEFGILAKK